MLNRGRAWRTSPSQRLSASGRGYPASAPPTCSPNDWIPAWMTMTRLAAWPGPDPAHCPGSPHVSLEFSSRWYARTCRNARTCWNYFSFRRVTGVTSVSKLALGPFLAAAGVQKSWYLLNVEFGFEILSGGKGLGVSSFTVTP